MTELYLICDQGHQLQAGQTCEICEYEASELFKKRLFELAKCVGWLLYCGAIAWLVYSDKQAQTIAVGVCVGLWLSKVEL